MIAHLDKIALPPVEPGPFYHLVPKDVSQNLEFRDEVLHTALKGKENMRQLWIMCSRDMLFWINTFVWTYDPRVQNCPELPFITYEYQDNSLLQMDRAITNEYDIGIEKSRDMGASWMALCVFVWRWLFRRYQTFLLASEKERKVDDTKDPDSLFWKIDFLLKRLPSWMCPVKDRVHLHLKNEENGSTIDGSATTDNMGRGGRRTGMLMDEFAAFELQSGYKVLASTQHNAHSRFFNSTPQGDTGALYDVMHKIGMAKLTLHWSVHPKKRIGLYRYEGKRLKFYDDYDFPDGYRFILDGAMRSPYYDKEEARSPVKSLIAQELDINYLGSGHKFFDTKMIETLIAEYGRAPYATGELVFDKETGMPERFEPEGAGCLRLWLQIPADGRPPQDRQYVVSADIGTGTGASNSVISVGDCATGELVAEYVSPHIDPTALGVYMVALARFFSDRSDHASGAYMIWEANGPGQQTGKKVVDLGYRRIYFKTSEKGIRPKISDIPGFWKMKDTGRTLLTDYGQALLKHTFVNRSVDGLEECKAYVYSGDGYIIHQDSLSSRDPSGARDNHGDRVISQALLAKGMKIMGERARPKPKIPPYSMAWRREQRKRKEQEAAFW